MLIALIRNLVKLLLWLRYHIRVRGVNQVRKRGRRGILFVPNHPAMIDPIVMMTYLNREFAPRALADEDQMRRPLIGWLARRLGVQTIPDTAKVGSAGRAQIEAALAETVKGLQNGENWLLYPAGRVYRGYREDLRGNSAVHSLLRQFPDVRVVLVRTRGLWGSRFSWASGRAPSVAETLTQGAGALLLNGLVFSPRREVEIEFCEPEDLPRTADRESLNQFLERFYNDGAPRNTYVPYTTWEGGGTRQLPEPDWGAKGAEVRNVPPATREIVAKYLQELTDQPTIRDEDRLAHDLGLDSLARADLLVWLEAEFGFPQSNPDSLETVADVLLAACGESLSAGPAALAPIPAKWFEDSPGNRRVDGPRGRTIAEAFLAQAERTPDRVVIADQQSGARTYRDLLTAIFVLKPHIEGLPGDRVGIMMPASVAADVLYLSVMFAGKTPVMVNWTVGERSAAQAIDLVGVKRMLTARALLSRLEASGTSLGSLGDRFVFLEELAAGLSKVQKLAAWLRSRISWRSLAEVRVSDTAAILFTSGSEAAPKAVPLSHQNVLTNLRDVCSRVATFENDRLIGFLPPFHSFGLTCTVLLPLCTGMRVAHYANPTDAGALAQLIDAYQATVLMGTPTFLGGITRAATRKQLSSLRVAVTGAEKCPERVYAALAEKCPQATVLEGYGITECSPIVSVNDEANPRPFTIGKVLPSLNYVIVDAETGERAERGRPGVLLVRGPSVFGGYLSYDGESPFVEFEGESWYRTGDIVCEDEDGVLEFSGRLKRFVKLGGEMISLPAIEAVLEECYSSGSEEGPALAVEATPDETHPELVLFTTEGLRRDAVNRQLREAGLSPLHNIRRVTRLEEIPTLGTGKTDYRALKRLLAE